MVIVTNQLLQAGMSYRGAWNIAQLRALLPEKEFDRPYAFPAKGWKSRLIGSKVSENQVKEFMRLKNRHLGHKRRKLPETKELWQGLTPEEQGKQIEKWQARKAQRNRIRDARKATKTKNCLTCFHYKVKACDGVSKNYKCKYWYKIEVA